MKKKQFGIKSPRAKFSISIQGISSKCSFSNKFHQIIEDLKYYTIDVATLSKLSQNAKNACEIFKLQQRNHSML